MKKSPLLRKTSLKRKLGNLKRAKLKPESRSKHAWRMKYREQRLKDATLQRPVDMPHLLCHKDNQRIIHRHHPFAQMNDAILAYVYISKKCHDEIHSFSKSARLNGWLQGPYDGRPIDPQAPRPWTLESESAWPDKYKRTQP